MTTTPEDLQRMGIKFLTIEKLHSIELVVYDQPNEAKVMANVKKALLAGHAVTYPGNRKVWYDVDWVTKKETPHEPIWHEDGERIRKKRIEVTQYPDGRIEKKDLGEFWGAWE